MKEESDIIIASEATLAPLRHPWRRCITVGRAYEILRGDLQSHLRILQGRFSYEFIRFHASFHDDVKVVERLPDGTIAYRWSQLDHIYDFIVQIGLKPIVEINPMPKALASGDKNMFWYNMNVTPPANMEAWETFLRAFIAHIVERYGIDKVRQWRFEVWNEPDLNGQFWSGSQEDYFALYAVCARILKSYDSDFLVGGPASAGTSWVFDLLDYCRQNEIPLDFLTYHNYPQNEANIYPSQKESPHLPGMFFIDRLSEIQRGLKERHCELPVYITEWNSQTQTKDWKAEWVGNETVNNSFAGALVCHLAHGCDTLVDLLGWWVASDVFEEGGPQVEPYGRRYQYYGMLTFDGLPKSSYHAFDFLNEMRGLRYSVRLPLDTSPTCGLICTDEVTVTRCLLWNARIPGEPMEHWSGIMDVPLPKLAVGRPEIRVTTATVLPAQGSAYEFWQNMGSPANLTKREQVALSARALPQYESRTMETKGKLVSIKFDLAPNTFSFIEVGGELDNSLDRNLGSFANALNDRLQT